MKNLIKEEKEKNEGVSFLDMLDVIDFRDDLRYK